VKPNGARSPCRQDAFCEGTQDRGFRDAVVEGLAVAPRLHSRLEGGSAVASFSHRRLRTDEPKPVMLRQYKDGKSVPVKGPLPFSKGTSGALERDESTNEGGPGSRARAIAIA